MTLYSFVIQTQQEHDLDLIKNFKWILPKQLQAWSESYYTTAYCLKGFLILDLCMIATHAAFRDVVGIMHDVSGQAKVADLHQFALTDQHVPGSEITMNALWWNKVKQN